MPTYRNGDLLLNKYRIEKLVGTGAFGEVYLATHIKLESPRALKVLRKDTESGVSSQVFQHYRERFELEARLGARVNHPNVIQVYDFDQEEDELVLAMEYAPGGSLETWIDKADLERKPMEIPVVLRLGRDVAEGLSALHARDIIHRDLKPSNILFAENGSVKLGDLGVAQTSSGGLTHRTSVSEGAPRHPGTPAFMSPEQETSFTYLAPSSDIYALGVVLFLTLTLRNPKNLPAGTLLRNYRPDAPTALDALLAEMLDADPRKRPFSGEMVVKRLDEISKPTPTFAPVTPPAPPSGSRAARPPSWDREGTALHSDPSVAQPAPAPVTPPGQQRYPTPPPAVQTPFTPAAPPAQPRSPTPPPPSAPPVSVPIFSPGPTPPMAQPQYSPPPQPQYQPVPPQYPPAQGSYSWTPPPAPPKTSALGCSFLFGWIAAHAALGLAAYYLLGGR